MTIDAIPTSEDTRFFHANGNAATTRDEEPSFPSTENTEIELIFLGTGTSSSVPLVHCLTAPPSVEPCKTCLSTLTPEGKKNIRRNTSAVVRMSTGKDGKKTTLLIDVGKNFQAAAVEWFPKHGLREIDGILITHAHADAMNGLDDLRGWTLRGAIQKHIDVYVSRETLAEIKRTFPYLVAKEFASGGGDVPEFKWHIIEDKVPFEIDGMRIMPFLVQHGRLFSTEPTPDQMETEDGGIAKIRPYLCFGFIVQDAIVYMSDVSRIPDDAWPVIQAGGRKSVLVTDCLRLSGHMSHMGLRDAAETVRRVGAKRSYLIGFNHDLTHDEYMSICTGRVSLSAREREKEGIAMMREGLDGEDRWVRPAYDGLVVNMST